MTDCHAATNDCRYTYRVFVVEDDPKMAELICEYLERYGYLPSRAVRFDDLKSEFLRLAPHLVLLDINLPYMDGFYWCRQIRTVSSVPIVFISARTADPDQIRAIENGGDDYITKPFNAEVMIAKIRSALRRSYGEYSVQQSGFSDVVELAGLYLHRSKCVLRSKKALWPTQCFSPRCSDPQLWLLTTGAKLSFCVRWIGPLLPAVQLRI